MPRRFNITGPCVPGRDFHADLRQRLQRPLAAVRRGESLVLTRGRQTGKTTLLRELAAALRREGFAVVLCALQLAEDQSLLGLLRQIEHALRLAHPVPAPPKWMPTEPQSASFCAWIGEAQRALGRPLVLLLDEYDAPPRKLVTALLRSLRAALTLADEARPFAHAVVLCGKTNVRELRDELRPQGDESRGTGSLWNVALPLALGPLSRSEVDSLLDTYTKESGVVFSPRARDELYSQSRGQPYLVSRLCYILDEQLGSPRPSPPRDEAAPLQPMLAAGEPQVDNRGAEAALTIEPALEPPAPRSQTPPSAETIRAAAEQILEEDQTHLCGLSDVLNGRREAQELVLRLLGGEEIPLQRTNEAQSYLLDAGLIIPTESQRLLELASPIYASYLSRWLTDQ